MKFSHAAELALVGWYLMVPPLQKPHSTLSHWKTLKVFDMEALCETKRKAMVEEAESDETGESGVIGFETPKGKKEFIARAALCVATNDPRLHRRGILHRRDSNKP